MCWLEPVNLDTLMEVIRKTSAQTVLSLLRHQILTHSIVITRPVNIITNLKSAQAVLSLIFILSKKLERMGRFDSNCTSS